MFPEGRLFDFLIVGAVALIVVGPKDLPLLMRKVGQFMARVRGMAAEFRASFDELARQSELDELRKEVNALRSARPLDVAAQHVGADGLLSDIRTGIDDTNNAIAEHAALPGAAPPPGPVMTALPSPVEAAPEAPPEPPQPTPPQPTPPKPSRARKPKAPAS